MNIRKKLAALATLMLFALAFAAPAADCPAKSGGCKKSGSCTVAKSECPKSGDSKTCPKGGDTKTCPKSGGCPKKQ